MLLVGTEKIWNKNNSLLRMGHLFAENLREESVEDERPEHEIGDPKLGPEESRLLVLPGVANLAQLYCGVSGGQKKVDNQCEHTPAARKAFRE